MKINTFIFLIISIVLSSCTSIEYQVSARKDPFIKNIIAPSTFAFRTDTTNSDILVEKNIFLLISNTLSAMGWQMTPIIDAEYVISVKFNMTDKQSISSHEVNWYYDKETKKVIDGQQQTQTDYYFERVVKITVYKGTTSKEYIWSADCISKGSTQDILFAAKYMIPYAMHKFPEQGIWNNKERVEK